MYALVSVMTHDWIWSPTLTTNVSHSDYRRRNKHGS